MVGVHAVSGGVDVGQVGAHGLLDHDGALDAQLRPDVGGELGVGTHPYHDQAEIKGAGDYLVTPISLHVDIYSYRTNTQTNIG